MFQRLLVSIMPGFMVRFFARPYIAGYSMEAGLETAKRLWEEEGLSSTIDLLGEDFEDEKDIQFAKQLYVDLINAVGKSEYATVSVKPTLFGASNVERCYKHLEDLVDLASKYDLMIEIDMEDHRYTDMTLEIYKRLKAKYDNVGTVLQARLFRTRKDIDELGDIHAKIRMCIGIYNEPPEIALQKKKDMKERMLEYAQILLDRGHMVAFATHDEHYIHRMLKIAEEKGYTPDRLEFQMLLGVPRRRIQQEILAKGYTMRLYVPFAVRKEDGTAYLKRRLAKNPNIIGYGLKNLFGAIFNKRKSSIKKRKK